MGNHGDGIGRLVMRGKTCEIKAAAPRGQAPTRGGKAYRNNRGGPRNQHQARALQVPSFGHNEQFPVMYPHDNYNVPYPQGVYSTLPSVPGYAPPIYHHAMPPSSNSQPHSRPHGSIPFGADRNLGDSGIAGGPYFFASPLAAPPPEGFSVPNGYPHTPQIPANFQQGYAFIPYAPDHAQLALPVMEVASMRQTVEQNIEAEEKANTNDKGGVKVEKE